MLPVGIFVLALALRLPYLLEIPAFVDEGLEVLWGLDIAEGRRLPLTGYDAYYGPLFPYLMAGVFLVFGPDVMAPRLTTAVFGALTVAATYGLGRVVWGRAASVLAAGLAATSPALILNGSHQGWSSSLTPFFLTLTALTCLVAVAQSRGWLMVLSGVLAAGAVHSHPTSAVALVGLACWLLATPSLRPWLRRPAPYLALAAFLLAYSPMLIANLHPDSPLVEQVASREYAFRLVEGPYDYALRVLSLVKNLAYVAGAAQIAQTIPLRLVLGIPGGLLLGLGLVILWCAGRRGIPLMLLSTVLLMVILVKGQESRYFVGMVPLTNVAVAVAAVEAYRYVRDARSWFGAALPPVWLAERAPLRRVAAMLVVGLVVAVLVSPSVTLPAYYQRAIAAGATNVPYFSLAARVMADGACGSDLFLDPGEIVPADLDEVSVRFALLAAGYVLALHSCAYTWMPPDKAVGELARDRRAGWLLLPADAARSSSQAARLEPTYTVSVVMVQRTVSLTFARVSPHD